MLHRLISGGQTGADRAGWRAAKAAGIPTGRAMPLGFLADDSCHPEFAKAFGAHQLATNDYPARTESNVRASDGTLVRLTIHDSIPLHERMEVQGEQAIPVRAIGRKSAVRSGRLSLCDGLP
jgi:hypothetical protein